MEIAGRMGMSETEFLDCTPRFFYNRQRGYMAATDAAERGEWERTRWLAFFVLTPHRKKRLKMSDLAVFPWEKEEKSDLKDPETLDRFKKILADEWAKENAAKK